MPANRQNFKVGEVVQLKSGGPKMTVEEYGFDENVICQWFAGGKLSQGDFPPESLVRVEEEEGDKKKK